MKSSVTEFLRDAMAGGDEARATEYLVLGVSKRSSLGRAKRTIDALFNRLDKAVLGAVSAPRAAYAAPTATSSAPPAPSVPWPSAVPAGSGGGFGGSSLLGAAVGIAFAMLPKVIEGASDFASSVLSGAKEKAGEFFSSALQATRAALTTAGKWITESAQSVSKAVREGASSLVDRLKEGAGAVGDILYEKGLAVWDRVTATYESVKSSAVAIVKTQTAVPTSLAMQSRDAVFGLWEETKKTVRSWLWDILNVFNNTEVGTSSSGGGGGGGGQNAGYGRRALTAGSGRSQPGGFDSSVKTPAGGGTAGGAGAFSGFTPGSATLSPEQSAANMSAAQKFVPQSGPLEGGKGVGFNPGQNGVAAKNQSAKESYDFWRGKGLTHVQAMGMVAHEMTESGGNPRAFNGNGENSGGLYQWSLARRAAILKGTGIDVNTATAQQQREAAYWEFKNVEKRAWNMLTKAQTKREAVEAGLQFERPKDMNPAYRMGKYDEYEGKLSGAGMQAPPKPMKTRPVDVPAGAPITGDLTAPPGLFDTKKKATQRPPAMYTGGGVSGDALGFGGKADFGRGISSPDADKKVEPAKRFETKPDKPAEEGGSSPQSSRDDEPDSSDSPSERRKRHAIMMNNDAGTYLISHQEALA